MVQMEIFLQKLKKFRSKFKNLVLSYEYRYKGPNRVN